LLAWSVTWHPENGSLPPGFVAHTGKTRDSRPNDEAESTGIEWANQLW
jgi:hypothetical protein